MNNQCFSSINPQYPRFKVHFSRNKCLFSCFVVLYRANVSHPSNYNNACYGYTVACWIKAVLFFDIEFLCSHYNVVRCGYKPVRCHNGHDYSNNKVALSANSHDYWSFELLCSFNSHDC
ncbi:MAG: hypothetical protein Q8909_02115 [Bacteroidota bacterium]|nr:hypothetical protein [Bacteroidota bacterium]